MEITPLSSTLASAVDQAIGAGRARPTPAGASDFVASLEAALKAVSAQQAQSTSAQRAFQIGDPTASLEATMVAMSKAQISFQATVQVRNKLVQAYESVMNMPV